MRKLRILLADDEELICVMLQKLIDFDGLNLDLCGIANDGEELLAKILSDRPDIVLTDISMPIKDGLEVIREIREREIPCKFVIISGYRQFEYAYNALKYNVEDYILKPVEKEELNRVLAKLTRQILETKNELQDEREGLHAYFLERAVHNELKTQEFTLDEINRQYGLDLHSGVYRIAFIRIDMPDRNSKEDISSVITKIKMIAEEMLCGCCFEVVYNRKTDGLYLMCNFSPEQDRVLQKAFRDLYERTHHICDMFSGLQLTLCVGKSVERIDQLEESKNSCRRATWLRMHYGTNRIIFEEEYPEVRMGGFHRQMEQIGEQLEKAVTALDKEEAAKQIDALFALPSYVLCSSEAMQYVRDCIRRFDRRCIHISNALMEEGKISVQILDALHRKNSFAEYRDEMKTQYLNYMCQFSEVAQKKNAKPIRKAMAYVDDHFSEHISLEDVASYINLNPVYFSNLFKKETGKTFGEYLTAYRVDMAKKLLRNGKMNINEISDYLGYANARYFSSVFKKEVGIKPTEYRKIYG